jgi:copper chaperone CopZ
MKYKIEGIDCASCASIIKMSLEDEGFEGVEVDAKDEELTVPEKYTGEIAKIKEIVDGAGHYELLVK